MEQAPSSPMLKFGPYRVDLAAGEVRKNGLRIRLQDKPLRVLVLLAERQGQLVTREELKKHLWVDDTFVDFETGLNTAVSKLRDALSDSADAPRYIETIPRRGYRFMSPVEFLGGAPAGEGKLENNSVLASTILAVAPEVAPPMDASRLAAASKFRVSLWVSLIVASVLLGGVAYWLTHGRPALSFHSNDTVLIADFDNQTGDTRFDNALSTAFGVSIAQSRYANVYPRMQLEAVLKRMGRSQLERINPALGREICQRENIRGLVTVSITRTGQEYAITAELIDPRSGQSVRSYTERSHGEDRILDSLEVLSKEMREALGESLYQIHQDNKPLPQVTTRSLTALQEYSEGSTLWHNGKYQDAGVQFNAAIASDPDFAMAHAALGRADYSFIYNQQVDGQKEYEKALSLLSRTTEREHMIIETDYAMDRKHEREADFLLRAYLSRYPDDAEMRLDYGNLLRQSGREKEGIEQYNQAIRILPNFAHAYIGVATAYKSLGNYPAALEAYSKAFAIDPQWMTAGNINREYGFALVANGQIQKAEEVFSAQLAKSQTRENGLRSLAFLDLYQGKYASAQIRLQQSLEIVRINYLPVSLVRVYLLLGMVAGDRGDNKGQLQNLDAALSKFNDVQAKVLLGAMLGDAYARAGVLEQAQKIAAIIEPLADKGSAEQMGYLHLVQGEIALSLGERGKAIELLEQSDKEKRTGLSIEALAHAYQESGQIDKAIKTYEDMFRTTELSLGWEPQQRWLEALYTLSQDYLASGEKQKARETLTILLNLWKDGDLDLPLLKQAKAEYAKLQ